MASGKYHRKNAVQIQQQRMSNLKSVLHILLQIHQQDSLGSLAADLWVHKHVPPWSRKRCDECWRIGHKKSVQKSRSTLQWFPDLQLPCQAIWKIAPSAGTLGKFWNLAMVHKVGRHTHRESIHSGDVLHPGSLLKSKDSKDLDKRTELERTNRKRKRERKKIDNNRE